MIVNDCPAHICAVAAEQIGDGGGRGHGILQTPIFFIIFYYFIIINVQKSEHIV